MIRVRRVHSSVGTSEIVYTYDTDSYDGVREEDEVDVLMLVAASDSSGYSHIAGVGSMFTFVNPTIILLVLYTT